MNSALHTGDNSIGVKDSSNCRYLDGVLFIGERIPTEIQAY